MALTSRIPIIEVRAVTTSEERVKCVMDALSRVEGSEHGTSDMRATVALSELTSSSGLARIATEELKAIRVHLGEVQEILSNIVKDSSTGKLDNQALAKYIEQIGKAGKDLHDSAMTVRLAMQNKNIGLTALDDTVREVIALYEALHFYNWKESLEIRKISAPTELATALIECRSDYGHMLLSLLFDIASALDGVSASSTTLSRIADLGDVDLNSAIIKNPNATTDLRNRLVVNVLARMGVQNAELLR